MLSGETMGTSWSASIVGGAPGLADEIQGVLTRIVSQMSHWEPGSDISRFNRSEPGRWQPMHRDFETVLRTALEIAEASGGAFDPAMGALADLWGFGPLGPRPFPDETAVRAALVASGRAHIEQDNRRARRTAPVHLDFSGIAKGHAVDAVAERLLALDHSDFLVEIGGELRGAGIKPDGQPWWVDLETMPGAALPSIRVALHGLSVATSGNYRRNFRHAGTDYAHTLDPRTGWPLQNQVASVTVLHPCCMRADAWATALTVLGPDGMELAGREGLAAHMVVGRGPAISEHLSPALSAMLV